MIDILECTIKNMFFETGFDNKKLPGWHWKTMLEFATNSWPFVAVTHITTTSGKMSKCVLNVQMCYKAFNLGKCYLHQGVKSQQCYLQPVWNSHCSYLHPDVFRLIVTTGDCSQHCYLHPGSNSHCGYLHPRLTHKIMQHHFITFYKTATKYIKSKTLIVGVFF